MSIKNLHNVFLTESYKSRTVVMQSIGRAMRKHTSKINAVINDFIDDFRVTKSGRKHKNYMLDQGLARVKYYKKYYNDYKEFTVDLTPAEEIPKNSLF